MEECDGLDKDCNGTVDDEPAADNWCLQTKGPGSSCQNGSCPCPLTLCNNLCVDVMSDPSNCGGCGAGCGANKGRPTRPRTCGRGVPGPQHGRGARE